MYLSDKIGVDTVIRALENIETDDSDLSLLLVLIQKYLNVSIKDIRNAKVRSVNLIIARNILAKVMIEELNVNVKDVAFFTNKSVSRIYSYLRTFDNLNEKIPIDKKQKEYFNLILAEINNTKNKE